MPYMDKIRRFLCTVCSLCSLCTLWTPLHTDFESPEGDNCQQGERFRD